MARGDVVWAWQCWVVPDGFSNLDNSVILHSKHSPGLSAALSTCTLHFLLFFPPFFHNGTGSSPV